MARDSWRDDGTRPCGGLSMTSEPPVVGAFPRPALIGGQYDQSDFATASGWDTRHSQIMGTPQLCCGIAGTGLVAPEHRRAESNGIEISLGKPTHSRAVGYHVFMKPHLGRSILFVLGIVLAGLLLIGGIVLFFLRLQSQGGNA